MMSQPGRSLAPEAAVASAEPQPGVLASPRPTAEERLRVLITGASGMLGSELTPVIAGAGYEVYPRPRAELDVTDVEEVARLPDRLGGPEEEEPRRLQRVVERGDEPLLEDRFEVDEEVPATDEVDP